MQVHCTSIQTLDSSLVPKKQPMPLSQHGPLGGIQIRLSELVDCQQVALLLLVADCAAEGLLGVAVEP